MNQWRVQKGGGRGAQPPLCWSFRGNCKVLWMENLGEIRCNKCALCILEMGFLWNECSDVLENRI